MRSVSEAVLEELNAPAAETQTEAAPIAEGSGDAVPAAAPGGEATPEPSTSTGEDTAAAGAEKGDEGEKSGKPEEKKTEETPAPPRLFKVKVDGEEREIPEADVIKGYQLAAVSHKRIQEATERTKAINWTLEQLVEKPQDVWLQLAGHKLGSDQRAQQAWDEMCLSRVKELIAEEGMSAEQRQILEDRRRLEKEKREVATQREKSQREVQEKLNKQAEERLERDVRAALTKHQLPENKFIISRIAYHLEEAFNSGIDMTAEEAAYEAGKEWEQVKADSKKSGAPAKPAAPAERKEATAFPSTQGEGGQAKAPQRPRQKRFGSIHDFHRHIAESAG
jgi:colicin import membrane protein